MIDLNNKKILIVAAHPDDEVLGCGGTITKCVQLGSDVHVVFFTDGQSSRQDDSIKINELIASRKESAKLASKILGIKSLQFGSFPDNSMDSVPLISLAKYLEPLVEKIQPEIIFTHYWGDLNIDHRLVYDAVCIVSRPQSKCPIKIVLCFEIPSSTEWKFQQPVLSYSPNIFIDITQYFENKILALGCYQNEMRNSPHPRSIDGIEALARWRGSTIGVNFAESFILGRYIG